jgi:hypothetical protein
MFVCGKGGGGIGLRLGAAYADLPWGVYTDYLTNWGHV